MWKCRKCGTVIENEVHEACWNCSHLRDGEPSIENKREKIQKELKCLRCSSKMDYLGMKDFQEGSKFPFLGNLGQLLSNVYKFKVFSCPSCGKVEFFME